MQERASIHAGTVRLSGRRGGTVRFFLRAIRVERAGDGSAVAVLSSSFGEGLMLLHEPAPDAITDVVVDIRK
jgi:hypothetical protein